jgi:hypothetical protein
VRVLEPLADLDHEWQLVLEVRDRTPGDELAELVAFQELHDDEQVAVRLAEIVDGHDVGVAELRARLRLAEEPGPQLVGVVGLGRDDLQRHRSRIGSCAL